MPRGRALTDVGGAKPANGIGANLGFEAKLWAAADALRNNMDAAEYKHVVLGLIFLKYISDAFEAKHEELATQKSEGADPEDPDEYRAVNIFWVPPEARWTYLKSMAPQPTIGQLVDDAMSAIERDNPSLKGVLPKDYARPGLDKQRLGQLINLVSDIALGAPADRAKDTLGRVYEYFLSQFASAEACACWSRCWLHTRAASTTPVAAPAECSCRARSSSARTPTAMATAARPRAATGRPESPSTVRSPTTRRGALLR
jgi:hypothetical protein